MMIRVAFCALLTLPLSTMAQETAVKMFAGPFESAAALQARLKEQITVTKSDATIIPCDAGTQFGIVYLLKVERALSRRANDLVFTETWFYPGKEGEPETPVSRDFTTSFKRRTSSPLFAGTQLTDEVGVDHTISLEVTQGGDLYMDHRFQVLGCTPETRVVLQEAMKYSDEDKIVCELREESGSRIKTTVCLNEERADEENDSVRRKLGR